MHILLIILLIIVCLILLGVSGFFSVKGAIDVKDSEHYSSDTNLQKAHKYLSIVSTIIWVSIAVLILFVILFIVFGAELLLSSVGKLFFWALFLALLVLLGVTAGYSGMAAEKIRSSSHYPNNKNASKAFTASIIALGSSAGALLMIIALFVGTLVTRMNKGKKSTKPKQNDENDDADGDYEEDDDFDDF